MPSRIWISDSRQVYDGISSVRHSLVSPSKSVANFVIGYKESLTACQSQTYTLILALAATSVVGAALFPLLPIYFCYCKFFWRCPLSYSEFSMAASHFSKDTSDMRLCLSDMHSKMVSCV